MTHILRIETSIKGEASVSRKLTDRVVSRLTASHAGATVTTRDLAPGVPQIDGSWMSAVYTPAGSRTPDQAKIAGYSDALLDEVKAADVLVIALPVYNFGLPAQLKSWIDHLARKGETFNYTETGPVGLLKNKRAIVALSSDGTKMGSEIDFASGYLRHMLGFFGITDVEFVAADQMVFDPEATLTRAEAEIDRLAA
ncbi:FMN-dependent NADH-azoreductase [Defluviimonas aquaemixtae]|uniref:FMN dependent NADH:quinone oxidoreductase n=1 Tax=Albidovulum aquaemixtae TaxID=1542388 RepID=A0A2R8B271_9RHOB|nr:NAD(P)H-dependent oxidoreductase [Defluviimonas aquaemixtae]SPH16640.1 FMN-dependent NADH-azoreductase [Defluviimonas aquaemixtae]